MAFLGIKRVQPIIGLKALLGYGTGTPPAGTKHQRDFSGMGPSPYGVADPLWDHYSERMELSSSRLQIYKELYSMDIDDIVGAAAALYSEDATQTDMATGKMIWMTASDPEIQKLADQFLETVRTEEKVTSVARTLVMYGNEYESILQSEKEDGTPGEIIGTSSAPVATMHRHFDSLNRLVGFSRGAHPDMKSMSLPWDYVQFRLLSKRPDEQYGTSLFMNARRIFQQLRLAEEAMLLYRMRRAPDRLVFYVDVGEMGQEEAVEYVNTQKRNYHTRTLYDPTTGTMRQESNPLGATEDLWIPSRPDSNNSRVEKIAGSNNSDRITDIEYLRKRLYGALRIPPDYLGFSESKAGFAARSTLESQDIQFGRSCQSVQKAVMNGYLMMFQIDLCWRGIDVNNSKNETKVHMCPVSFLDELQKSEVIKTRSETLVELERLGEKMGIDKQAWLKHIWKYSGFPEELIFPEAHKVGQEISLTGKLQIDENKKKEAEAEQAMSEDVQAQALAQLLGATKIKDGMSFKDINTHPYQLPFDGSRRVMESLRQEVGGKDRKIPKRPTLTEAKYEEVALDQDLNEAAWFRSFVEQDEDDLIGTEDQPEWVPKEERDAEEKRESKRVKKGR